MYKREGVCGWCLLVGWGMTCGVEPVSSSYLLYTLYTTPPKPADPPKKQKNKNRLLSSVHAVVLGLSVWLAYPPAASSGRPPPPPPASCRPPILGRVVSYGCIFFGGGGGAWGQGSSRQPHDTTTASNSARFCLPTRANHPRYIPPGHRRGTPRGRTRAGRCCRCGRQRRGRPPCRGCG